MKSLYKISVLSLSFCLFSIELLYTSSNEKIITSPSENFKSRVNDRIYGYFCNMAAEFNIEQAVRQIKWNDINSQHYHNDSTALHMAIGYRFYFLAEGLLNYYNADPNIQDRNGNTPLHILSKSYRDHDTNLMRDLLLSHGANLSIVNKDGKKVGE